VSTPPPVRRNGLAAESYVALLDCPPGTADALLRRLAAAGIAAYATAGLAGSPPGPVERVFVDAARAVQARMTLAPPPGSQPPEPRPPELRPPDQRPPDQRPPDQRPPDQRPPDPQGAAAQMSAAETDRAFEALVAGFDDDPGTGDWPDREGAGPLAPAPAPARRPLPPPPEHGHRAWHAAAVDPLAEEHYEPPDPEPIPQPRGLARWALGALVAGMVLLFSPVIPGLHWSTGAQGLGVGCVLAGVVLFVLGLRDTPRDPDDPDRGAVV
jgi:hypothetical protein